MIEMTAPDLADCGYDFKQVILEDFKEDVPISGGWGYTREDAIIIASLKTFVSLEYFLVGKRIYEELIIFRKKGTGYAGIKWNRRKQFLRHQDGKDYDCLEVDVTCHKEADWLALKEEYESNNCFEGNPGLKKVHFERHESLKHYYKTWYWFDITQCFGKKDLPIYTGYRSTQSD